MDVIRLLKSKNRCLQKFLELSTEFLASAEAGDLTRLDRFQVRRESTLKALELYDRKISTVVETLPSERRTSELIQAVSELLAHKDQLIQMILTTDNRIMLRIEEEKSRLLREMASNMKANETVKRFKSSWVSESGEGIDRKL